MSEEEIPILSEKYLSDISSLVMSDLRNKRVACQELETELSYIRRLLQGRIDILQDELKRRGEGNVSTATEIIGRLPAILADHPGGVQRRSRRVLRMLAQEQVVRVEREVDGIVEIPLGDIASATVPELETALRRLVEGEAEVSERRSALHRHLDTIHAEMARRYRDGEADVDTLLASES